MPRFGVVLVYALLAFPIYRFRTRPLRFGLALAAILLANPVDLDERRRVVFEERSFVGVNRVVLDEKRRFHQLLHGTTLHGIQQVNPLDCREPYGYYTRSSAVADVFAAIGDSAAGRRIAVAGLGGGALAAYARRGEQWTFYEIDPTVKRIATDPRLFCYLHECPAEVRVVLGDARLSLAATTERYDVMVLDAYSSDVIPVHLLTREALRLYLDHLTPHGVIALHISNRYFDLVPVVARLAEDAGLTCRARAAGAIDVALIDAGVIPSLYAVMARAPEDLRAIATDSRWMRPRAIARVGLWTDDYSSLVSVFRRRW
jgi:spermidine synthase